MAPDLHVCVDFEKRLHDARKDFFLYKLRERTQEEDSMYVMRIILSVCV